MTLMTKTSKKTLFGSFEMVIELLTQACCHTDVELAGIPYILALQMSWILSDNLGMCWLIKLRKYDPIEAFAFAHFVCSDTCMSEDRRANECRCSNGNTLSEKKIISIFFLSLNFTSPIHCKENVKLMHDAFYQSFQHTKLEFLLPFVCSFRIQRMAKHTTSINIFTKLNVFVPSTCESYAFDIIQRTPFNWRSGRGEQPFNAGIIMPFTHGCMNYDSSIFSFHYIWW